ncbi:MAG: tetratricopeptide repeat protein [Thermoplasmata archaeon]
MNDTYSLYKLAESTVCMMKWEDCVYFYSVLLQRDDIPEDLLAGAWHGYGDCLEKVKRKEESIMAYEKALEYHIRDSIKMEKAGPYLWGSWAALKLNKPDLAYEMIKKSLDIDPDYAYSWLTLSVIATKLKKIDEAKMAREKYKNIVEIKPYKNRVCEGLEMLNSIINNLEGEIKERAEKILKNTWCKENDPEK